MLSVSSSYQGFLRCIHNFLFSGPMGGHGWQVALHDHLGDPDHLGQMCLICSHPRPLGQMPWRQLPKQLLGCQLSALEKRRHNNNPSNDPCQCCLGLGVRLSRAAQQAGVVAPVPIIARSHPLNEESPGIHKSGDHSLTCSVLQWGLSMASLLTDRLARELLPPSVWLQTKMTKVNIKRTLLSG